MGNQTETKKGKSTLLKDAFVLFAITLVAGLLLSFVYEITKEPIAVAQFQAKMKAYQTVFIGADEFVENAEITEKVTASETVLTDAGLTGVTLEEVLEAQTADGSKAGYVMTVVGHEGYGGDIKISVGIDLEGVIQGMEVLSMSETAGLGAKVSGAEFKDQYKGKKGESIQFTKTGATKEDEIDAISGATITTKAATNAVNACLYFANHVLAEN